MTQTYIEKAIEKAIDGGWKPSYIRQYYCFKEVLMDNNQYELSGIFLDPHFWQALGKAEGWHQERVELKSRWCFLIKEYHKSDKIDREGKIIGESRDKLFWRIKWSDLVSIYNYPKNCIREEIPMLSWKEYQHSLIDHLAVGRDIESFFESLLAKK